MRAGAANPSRAIVVLGCRIHPSGRLPPAASRRAAAAADAYRAGVAPQIVTSGGRRWGSQVEALALKRALVGRGVPPAAVLPELFSLTTRENAVFSAALLRRIGVVSAVVVTSAWHMPRALTSFRAAGVDADAWPCEGQAGWVSRCIEGVRWLVDGRAMGPSGVLAESAAAFFTARCDR